MLKKASSDLLPGKEKKTLRHAEGRCGTFQIGSRRIPGGGKGLA